MSALLYKQNNTLAGQQLLAACDMPIYLATTMQKHITHQMYNSKQLESINTGSTQVWGVAHQQHFNEPWPQPSLPSIMLGGTQPLQPLTHMLHVATSAVRQAHHYTQVKRHNSPAVLPGTYILRLYCTHTDTLTAATNTQTPPPGPQRCQDRTCTTRHHHTSFTCTRQSPAAAAAPAAPATAPPAAAAAQCCRPPHHPPAAAAARP